MVIELILLQVLQASSCPSSAAVYVTSTVAAETHTGSPSDPFTGLDQALVATENWATTQLCLTASNSSFTLLVDFAVTRELLIAAESSQDLRFFASLTIRSGGSLTLTNVKITAGQVQYLMGVEGSLKLQGCQFVSIAEPIVMLYSGYLSVNNCYYVGNQAAAVHVLGSNAVVDILHTEVRAHVGTFALLAPTGSGQLAMRMDQSSLQFCQGRGLEPLLDFQLSGSSANVTILSSDFAANTIPILSFEISNSAVLLSNLSFTSNLNTGVTLAQESSTFLLSNSLWQGNQGALLTVTSLAGEATLHNLTLTEQQGLGFIHVSNAGDFSACVLVLQNSTVRDTNCYYPSRTFGIIAAHSCTVHLLNLDVSHVRFAGRTIVDLRSLFDMENGALSVSNLHSNHSGTSAYFLVSINSVTSLSNFTTANTYVGAFLVIGHVFGQLRIQSATFADVSTRDGDYQAVDHVFLSPVFVAWTGAEVQLQGLSILNQTYFWRYASLFVSSLSTFTLQDVLLDTLVMDVTLALTSSTGKVSGLVLKSCQIRLFQVQLFGVSHLAVVDSYINVRTIPCGPITCGSIADGIFGVASDSELNITNMLISNTNTTTLIFAKRATLRCWNLTLQGGTMTSLVGSAIGSSIHFSALNVLGCRTALTLAFQARLFIVDSQLLDMTGVDKFVLLYNSTLLFQRTVLCNVMANSVFGKLMQLSSLLIDNCTWKGVGTLAQSSNWLISNGQVKVTGSHFSSVLSSPIQATLSHIIIVNSTFRDVANQVTSVKSEMAYGGLVSCVDCYSLRLENVYVLNASAAVGGVLSTVSRNVAGQMYVRNGTFVLCSAGAMGGVIFIQDVSFEIDHCFFKYNKAGTSGGALDISVQSHVQRLVHNTVFTGNKAVEGGAVKWRNAPLTFSNVSFTGNTASYGSDEASYGVQLSLLTALPAAGAVSGQNIELTFEVLDHTSTPVTTATNYVLRILPNHFTAYTGNTVALCRQALCHFTGLGILTLPASVQSLDLVLQGAVLDIRQTVTLTFRNCTAGEVYRSNSCVYCYAGTVSYSPDDSNCTQCPTGAFCYGGSNMTLTQGYWRSAPTVTKVLQCPLGEKCLGDSTCAEGFSGKLCTECAAGHYRVRFVECSACGNAMGLVAVPVLVLLFLWAVFRFALQRPSELRLSVLKAAVSHAQLLSILAPFQLTYPPPIHYLLRALAYGSNLTLVDLPLACWNFASTELVKGVLGSLVFPMLLIFSALFALVQYKQYWRTVSVFLTSCLLFAPAACVQTLAPLLACEHVNSEAKWLFTDMSEQCGQKAHSLVVYCLMLPAAVLYLAVPLVLVPTLRYRLPLVFERYFPLWCAGQHLKAWDIAQILCKCTCLWLALCSIADTKLGQVTYAMISLITYAVLSAAFHRKAYTSSFCFALSELSTVIVTVSVAISSFYIYHPPTGGVSDLVLSVCFYVLNVGYWVGCLLVAQRRSFPSRAE